MTKDDKLRIMKGIESMEDIMNYYQIDFLIWNNDICLQDTKNGTIISKERLQEISNEVLTMNVEDDKQ